MTELEALRIYAAEAYMDVADLMERAKREGFESDDARVAWVHDLLKAAKIRL